MATDGTEPNDRNPRRPLTPQERQAMRDAARAFDAARPALETFQSSMAESTTMRWTVQQAAAALAPLSESLGAVSRMVSPQAAIAAKMLGELAAPLESLRLSFQASPQMVDVMRRAAEALAPLSDRLRADVGSEALRHIVEQSATFELPTSVVAALREHQPFEIPAEILEAMAGVSSALPDDVAQAIASSFAGESPVDEMPPTAQFEEIGKLPIGVFLTLCVALVLAIGTEVFIEHPALKDYLLMLLALGAFTTKGAAQIYKALTSGEEANEG